MQTYYELFGVPETASRAEIKKAFAELARQYHTDRVGQIASEFEWIKKEADERLAAINEAWDVLGDPQKRAGYDQRLRTQRTQYSHPGPGPSATQSDTSSSDSAAWTQSPRSAVTSTGMARALSYGQLLVAGMVAVLTVMGALFLLSMHGKNVSGGSALTGKQATPIVHSQPDGAASEGVHPKRQQPGPRPAKPLESRAPVVTYHEVTSDTASNPAPANSGSQTNGGEQAGGPVVSAVEAEAVLRLQTEGDRKGTLTIAGKRVSYRDDGVGDEEKSSPYGPNPANDFTLRCEDILAIKAGGFRAIVLGAHQVVITTRVGKYKIPATQGQPVVQAVQERCGLR